MEVDLNTYMKFLRDNVSELNRLGKEWGMTEEEINSCIERALKDEPAKEPVKETNMSLARKTWHWIRVVTRWTCLGIGVIFAVFVLLYVISLFHAPTEMYISGLLQPYGYAIFRAVRLATLPLHDHFNITNLYDSECLIDNPWFKEPEYECELCENVKSHLEMESAENKTYVQDLMDQAVPVVFKGLFHHTVSYDTLHKMYEENKDTMDKSVHFFQSSVIGMETIGDLFKPDVRDALTDSEGVTIHWQTKNMAGSQVIRKIFPRPEFVPAESEVALEKTVFLDGPNSDHYELASSFMQIAWYTQAQNDRKVLLAPLNHCRKSCNPIQLKLQERDILMFSPTVWKVILLPNKKAISVGFMGSFSEPA